MSETSTKNEYSIISSQEKKLNSETIHDILVCEPITEKGRNSLANLGLSNDVSVPFFYEKLIVKSKYKFSKQNGDPVYGPLFYQYTLAQNQLEEILNNNKKFEERLKDDVDYGRPLLILGVAGNGKTIAVFRLMHDSGELDGIRDKKVVYIDLDEGKTLIRYGDDFTCEENKPYEMFGLSLFEQIMEYLRKYNNEYTELKKNHEKYFVACNKSNPFHNELFRKIEQYDKKNGTTETAVFNCIKSELKKHKEQEKKNQILFEILMAVMFCAEPNALKYIYIDNIEEYIKLNKVNIQIPDSDLAKIYKTIKDTINYTQQFYKDIKEKNKEIKTFKIIMAMRRTSLALLEPKNLHFVASDSSNVNDVTGQIQLSDIWVKKKREIWERFLKKHYENDSSEKIIHILDTLMEDGPERTGVCYQSLIAPLMSYGLRRNARSQAYATEQVYKYLSSVDQSTINYDTFSILLTSPETGNNEVRYMLRRALIEIQFKWAATPTKNIGEPANTRWKNLNIGHLGTEETIYIGTKRMNVNKVEYDDPYNISLVRRILSALTYESDQDINTEEMKSRHFNTMFPTISLSTLITRVLNTPQPRTIEDDEYAEFAKVLLALGDMANGDTRSAPYVILNINNDEFRKSPSVETLATIFKIMQDKNQSENYSKEEYSVRITDAGKSFLVDWQYSYTFFAALYCYSCPPLFFLKDDATIKHVIKTVFSAAKDVCEEYHKEADRFCLSENMVSGTYMPTQDGKYHSFRTLLKRYHSGHLDLYRSYIQKHCKELGLESKRDELIRFIKYYQRRYNEEIMDDNNCF